MRNLKIIIVILVAVVISAAALVISNNDIFLKQEAIASERPSFDSKLTGSMASGDALIELTPAIDSNKILVNFNINTHSVSLSGFDLKDITTLEYEGKVIKPVKAGRIGGHHSSGTIVFDTGKDISSFTIRIKGIPNVKERVYEWNAG